MTTLTVKGQVTIPVRIRRLLGLKPNDRIGFDVQDGKVTIVRARSVRDVFGAVKPIGTEGKDFSAMIRAVKDERAARTTRNLRRSR